MAEPILCLVKGSWAYFTTQSLQEQWGDDWDDAPYKHNAGDPYRWNGPGDTDPPWDIIKVAWDGPFDTPQEESVENINAGATPWLSMFPGGLWDIWAGTPLSEFISWVQAAGGTVYTAEPIRDTSCA